MRYSADRKEKTRAKILEAAGRVFRREGYHAAGVDKVMAEAGMTAGGFYAHFESKQALLAEALESAAAETGKRSMATTECLTGRDWVVAFLEHYLNREHCRQLENGCPLAALVSEVARADESVKQSFEGIVRELAGEVASHAAACEGSQVDERAARGTGALPGRARAGAFGVRPGFGGEDFEVVQGICRGDSKRQGAASQRGHGPA